MLQKNRINKLPKEVADKIAAGEVVDRPLSIVKELLENAIDAGGDSIVIEIKNGGKTYIRLTDNGCGIPKEDLELAFQRHATSKIKTAEDLDAILTLGFRGEALASIAAVSRVELITKTLDEKLGSRLVIQGGQVAEQGDTGCPEGTTIIVSDLFYNTPARLKFMKQDATESSLIIDFVSKMALAYPYIRLRLINNGAILFATPGKGSVYANILTIYSKEIGDKLIHVTENLGDYSIDAFLSPLSLSKLNRKTQVFFVNGRHITSKVLENAVSVAYRERLTQGRYPLAFLFITVTPDHLDVNIHPNKREVRFDNNEDVTDFVVNSIQKGLTTNKAAPEINADNIFIRKSLAMQDMEQNSINVNYTINEDNNHEKGIYNKNLEKDELVDIKMLLSSERLNNKNSVQKEEKDDVLIINEDVKPFQPSSFTITGSIFGTYITAVDESNFYLIDQHAAHERVFYERLLTQLRADETASQILLSPFVTEISLAAHTQSEIWLQQLESIGYVLEEFGTKSYIIKAIPMFMSMVEANEFLDDYLDQLEEITYGSDSKKLDKIIMNACKSAVKANDRLDQKEMSQLLLDLAKTTNPLTCPHGRPTFIKLTKHEIEKMFKRV